MLLEPSAEIHLPKGGIITSRLADSIAAEGPFSEYRIYCDAEKSGSTVLVRYRQPGDRLFLSAGHKKLKDYLMDKKIPREKRDKIPLVVNRDTDEIIWVAGLKQTGAALADDNTKQYIILSYRERE